MKKLLCIAALLTAVLSGFAQPKYERESRISKTKVPETAVRFVDSLTPDSRITWYRETGYTSTSYEAKTRHKGKSLSVEFSENGSFEDVEVQVKPGDIPSGVYSKITRLLDEIYGKYSFERMQVQYSGNPQSVLDFFHDQKPQRPPVTQYELVVAAKSAGTYVMYEYLFDVEGVFLEKAEVLMKMTDNMEY
jgi:hypothetical protein